MEFGAGGEDVMVRIEWLFRDKKKMKMNGVQGMGRGVKGLIQSMYRFQMADVFFKVVN